MFNVIEMRNQDPETREVLAKYSFRAEAVSFCIQHRDEFEHSGYNVEDDRWWGRDEGLSDAAREWFVEPVND